jgi:hypothetical protein
MYAAPTKLQSKMDDEPHRRGECTISSAPAYFWPVWFQRRIMRCKMRSVTVGWKMNQENHSFRDLVGSIVSCEGYKRDEEDQR